jgi:hypothetical protein
MAEATDKLSADEEARLAVLMADETSPKKSA